MSKQKKPIEFDMTLYPITGLHDIISTFQQLFPEQRHGPAYYQQYGPLLLLSRLREDTVLVPEKYPAAVTWEFELKEVDSGDSAIAIEVAYTNAQHEIRTALTRMLRARTVQFSKLD